MNSFSFISSRIMFVIALISFISCRKDNIPIDQDGSLVDVSFQFTGFTSDKQPLSSAEGALKKASSSATQYALSDEYLYFWTFNNLDLKPEISFDDKLTTKFENFDGTRMLEGYYESNFTFKDDSFFAGSAWRVINGKKEILIKMPITNVKLVSGLGFSIGTPGSGMKDFAISYSTDKGVSYQNLSQVNPFKNITTDWAQQDYYFDLTSKNIKADEIWFRIKPLAGSRAGIDLFDDFSGVFQMDNLYLKGSVTGSVTPPVTKGDKLYYFLFNKDNSKPVISGVQVLDGTNTLKLTIPKGDYEVCFVSNDGSSDLVVPKDYTLSSFYISNVFSDYKASIYGYKGTLNVTQDQTSKVVLERLYSQVKVKFTDLRNLDKVTRIVVTPEHRPFFYAPFNTNFSTTLIEDSNITFISNFASDKEIVFNQFVGSTTSAKRVAYKLEVYGQNGLLRTVTLPSTLESNVQLVFTGDLLEVVDTEGVFSVSKNENWKPTPQNEVF